MFSSRTRDRLHIRRSVSQNKTSRAHARPRSAIKRATHQLPAHSICFRICLFHVRLTRRDQLLFELAAAVFVILVAFCVDGL